MHDDREFFCLTVPDWYYIGMWKFVLLNIEETKYYEYLFLVYKEKENLFIKCRGYLLHKQRLIAHSDKYPDFFNENKYEEDKLTFISFFSKKIRSMISQTVEEHDQEKINAYIKEYALHLSKDGKGKDLIKWLKEISDFVSISSEIGPLHFYEFK